MNRAVGACACALGAALASCTSSSPPQRALAAEDLTLDLLGPVLAIPGEHLMVPVAEPAAEFVGARVLIGLEDGRRLGGRLHEVRLVVDADTGGWLPPSGRWTVVSSARDAPAPSRGLARWMVMAELPLDAAGQSMTIGGRAVAVQWLPAPSSIEAPEARARPAARAPMASVLLEAERRSPERRWRARLVDGDLFRPDVEPRDRFDDPALEAMALSYDAQWAAAIAWLSRADPGVARRLTAALTASVRFPDGTQAPAWDPERDALDALLTDLLNAAVEPGERVRRAEAWLSGQIPAAAWIISHAGPADAPSGAPSALVGIANLLDRATLAWATPAGFTSQSDLRELPPGASAPFVVLNAASARGVDAHAGAWRRTMDVLPAVLAVEPPGLRFPDFRPDFTLARWRSGRPPISHPDDPWRTEGLLCRAAESIDSPRRRWVIIITCRAPDGADLAGDSVRLWIGDGQPIEVAADDFGGDATTPRSIRSEDGWTCIAPIPDDVIADSARLRLAVERSLPAGGRRAWPCALLPWQAIPGRTVVDLSAWDDNAP